MKNFVKQLFLVTTLLTCLSSGYAHPTFSIPPGENTSPEYRSVALVSFKILLQDDDAHMYWTTAEEYNHLGFEIQRYVIGRQWETIGFVLGNGTTIEEHRYTFVHKNIAEGPNYYRLKFIDFGEKITFSDVVKVTLKGDHHILIHPNPAQEHIIISNALGLATIYNAQGVAVSRLVIHQNGQMVDISDLDRGLYFIEVLTAEDTREVERFYKAVD